MQYEELRQRILALVAAAPDLARRRFAVDTIRMLAEVAEGAIAEDLDKDERDRLAASLAAVERGSSGDLEAIFPPLCAGTIYDEYRGDELHTVLAMLLLAIDYWSAHAQDGEPAHIAAIAEAAVSSVDAVIDGDTPGYSIHNMLGDALSAAEPSAVADDGA